MSSKMSKRIYIIQDPITLINVKKFKTASYSTPFNIKLTVVQNKDYAQRK